MDGLISYLGDHAWLRVLRALHCSTGPRCLRELAELSGLSPAGLQDVLRRLKKRRIVKAEKNRNKLMYSLALNVEEELLLHDILSRHERALIERRAALFSQRKKQAVEWIDETVELWQLGRASYRSAR